MGKTRAPTPVQCGTCGKMINRKADLPRHLLTHAEQKDKTFRCSRKDCNFTAWQESNLRIHEDTHTGNKTRKCGISGCTFKTAHPASLTRHRQRKHRGQTVGHSGDSNDSEDVDAPESRPLLGTQRTSRPRRRLSPYPQQIDKGSKNIPAIYNNELVLKRAQEGDAQYARIHRLDSPLPSNWGAVTALEATVAKHPQPPVLEPAWLRDLEEAQTASSSVLNDFNSSSNYLLPEVASVNNGPCLPFPFVQHAVNPATHMHVPLSPSLYPSLCSSADPSPSTPHPSPVGSSNDDILAPIPSSLSSLYSTNEPDGVPLPTPSLPYGPQNSNQLHAPIQTYSPLPTRDAQYASGYEHDGYTTAATFSGAPSNFPQPYSFATMNMNMGMGMSMSGCQQYQSQSQVNYPQTLVDIGQNYLEESYFYNNATHHDASTSGGFGMLGPY